MHYNMIPNISYQWRFFTTIEGAKGLNFAEYFRRNTCIRQMLGNICQLHVFFMRKSAQENRGFSKQMIFILEIRIFSLWSTAFAENFPTQWHQGALCPLTPSYPLLFHTNGAPREFALGALIKCDQWNR